jgi:hypothetical protein
MGHAARNGDTRNIYIILVVKPERERLLGRLRRGWEDNIKMAFKGKRMRM